MLLRMLPLVLQAWGPASGSSAAGSRRGIVTGYRQIPRKLHDRYRSPPKNYVQLLEHIKRTRDVQGLRQLVMKYGTRFDAVHVAAALAQMPKLYQPTPAGKHLNLKQRKQRKQEAARLLAQLQVCGTSA